MCSSINKDSSTTEVNRDGIPCRLIRLVPEVENQAGHFTCQAWSTWRVLYGAIPTLDRLPEVFVCVVNACRTSKSRSIIFQPKWYRQLEIPAKTVQRSLDRLERCGVLTQKKKKGRSREITLADHVPMELPKSTFRDRKGP